MEDENILATVFAVLLIAALALWVTSSKAYDETAWELEQTEIKYTETQVTLVATQTQLKSTEQARQDIATELYICNELLEEAQRTPPPTPLNPPPSNPSLQQLKQALKETNAENQTYNNSFVCTDFATLLGQQLKTKNIQSHLAIIYWNPIGAHAVLAVNTTHGIHYIEPMSDQILDHQDLFFRYPDMDRVVSIYETWKPAPFSCVFRNKVKKCSK